VSFSSGGFSDRFPRPQYQNEAVSGYLKKIGNKWTGLYNPNGRGKLAIHPYLNNKLMAPLPYLMFQHKQLDFT